MNGTDWLSWVDECLSPWCEGLRQAHWPVFAFALLYALVALACAVAYRRPAAAGPRELRWLIAAMLMGGVGLMTLWQLDLLLVHLLRELAHGAGWYEQRRQLQLLALAGCGGALLMGVMGAQRAPGAGRAARGLAAWGLRLGLLLVLTVAAMRMVSLHGTDLLLAQRFGPLSLGRLLELAGLLAVGLSCRGQLRRP